MRAAIGISIGIANGSQCKLINRVVYIDYCIKNINKMTK